jgi:hypothetical protein
MVSPAREAHEPDVPLQHHRLGLSWDAGQAEARSELALVHHALPDEVRVLHMVQDQGVEVARVGERAAHDLGVGDRARPVREGDGAGLAQEPDLGQLLALQPLRQGGGGADVHDGVVARPAQDEVDDGRIVEHRVGVRHRHDGGDAAGGGRFAGTPQGLAMGGARLPDEGAHVDEARREHLAAAIQHLGIRGNGHVRADIRDDAVLHQDAAPLLAAAGGIDQAGVVQQQGTVGGHRAHPGMSSKRWNTSFPFCLASDTISSAPAEGPPIRRQASHFATSRRATGWKISSKTASPIRCEPANPISGSAYHSPRTGRWPARNRRRAVSIMASTFAWIFCGSSPVPDR